MVQLNHEESFYLENNIGSPRDKVPFQELRYELVDHWFSNGPNRPFLNPQNRYGVKHSFSVVDHYSNIHKNVEIFTWQSDKPIPIQFFCDRPGESERNWLLFNEFTLSKFKYNVPRNPKNVLRWESHVGKCLLLEFFNQSVGTKICKHLDVYGEIDPERRENLVRRIKHEWDECGRRFEFSPYRERTRVNLSGGTVKPTYREVIGDESE